VSSSGIFLELELFLDLRLAEKISEDKLSGYQYDYRIDLRLIIASKGELQVS